MNDLDDSNEMPLNNGLQNQQQNQENIEVSVSLSYCSMTLEIINLFFN